MGRVLIIELRIHLLLSQSLKDKRRVRLHITEKLRQRYNLSVAETGSQDYQQTLDLTVAYAALNETSARRMEQTLRDELDTLLEGDGIVSSWDTAIV